MGEYGLQIIASLKIVWVAVGSLWYGLGGISNKWIRRFILPTWMGLGIWVFGIWTESFSPWSLLYSVLFCASLHLGYGGTDNVWIKLRKRAIYGLAIGVSAVPICVVSSMWWLLAIHIGCCVMGSVLLGVFNPSRNARSEETIIAVFSTLLVLFLQ
jgi:hypothetical protein